MEPLAHHLLTEPCTEHATNGGPQLVPRFLCQPRATRRVPIEVPGGVLGGHPDLPSGSVRIDDVSCIFAQLDGDDIVFEFAIDVIGLQPVQCADEPAQFGLGQSHVVTFADHVSELCHNIRVGRIIPFMIALSIWSRMVPSGPGASAASSMMAQLVPCILAQIALATLLPTVGFAQGATSLAPLAPSTVPEVSVRQGNQTWKRPATIPLAQGLPPPLSVDDPGAAMDGSVSLLLRGKAESLPSRVRLVSRNSEGAYMDSLSSRGLVSVACPAPDEDRKGPAVSCASSAPLWLSSHALDATHAALRGQALFARLGGSIEVWGKGNRLARFSVVGPSETQDTLEIRLRARIVAAGLPSTAALGPSEPEARAILARSLSDAAAIWEACGLGFGSAGQWDIRVTTPPPDLLLEIGCGGGTSAAGGTLGLRLRSGAVVRLKTRPGEPPASVAARLRALLLANSISSRLYINARAEHQARASVDLHVPAQAGQSPVLGPLNDANWSDDPTLRICEGSVDLADGLQHFMDRDSAAGTLEERALLRSLMDDDDSTIDLLVVPAFSESGRIGESFIASPGASLRNAVVLDRAGLFAQNRSSTLAHELGHILLHVTGHPDDFGEDTPFALMDSDAADASIFGPRRLSPGECARMRRQSGPLSPLPLLSAPVELR